VFGGRNSARSHHNVRPQTSPTREAVNYAAACISDDELEMQPGPSIATGSQKANSGRRKFESLNLTHSPSVRQQSAAPPPPKGPGVPTFQPMIPKTRAHSVYNTPPAAFKHLSTVSPDVIFRLF
jgi:hypothetical protein